MVYASCERCGRAMLGAGRVLATGRRVCFRCWGLLKIGPDTRRIDDGAVRSLAETKDRQQAAAKGISYPKYKERKYAKKQESE